MQVTQKLIFNPTKIGRDMCESSGREDLKPIKFGQMQGITVFSFFPFSFFEYLP